MKEIYKTIKEFEDYEVSNLGNVRGKKGILNSVVDKKVGYKQLTLYKDKKQFCRRIHILVWDTFGDKPRNGRKMQVDHIDHDKLNNKIVNLQLLPQRGNTNKYYKTIKTASKYRGVGEKYSRGKFWKWQARITIDGFRKHLGYFNNELDASKAYEDALEKINK